MMNFDVVAEECCYPQVPDHHRTIVFHIIIIEFAILVFDDILERNYLFDVHTSFVVLLHGRRH